jgi:ParB-like chromosome segregation protein Spo0J
MRVQNQVGAGAVTEIRLVLFMTVNVADIKQSTPARYPHIVRQYADRLAAGEVLPAILVSRNSAGLVRLVDGHHRLEAHRIAKRLVIDVFVMSVH